MGRELENSWELLRPGYTNQDWEPVSREALRKWLLELGDGGRSKFLIEAPSPSNRSSSYKTLLTLPVVAGFAKNWIHGTTEEVVSGSSVWRFLQDLTKGEDLVIGEPLRSLVDRGNLLTDVLRALWEIRFLSKEGLTKEPFIRNFTSWVTSSRTTGPILNKIGLERTLARHRRLEVFLFLSTLARQNGCFERGVFIIDGIEALLNLPSKVRTVRLKELVRLVKVTNKWSHLGAPIGYIIGYSETKCANLKGNRFYRELVYTGT